MGQKLQKSISIVKEHGTNESRVVLVPNDVAKIAQTGCQILVENGAGLGIGISNRDYEVAGARIVNQEIAWTESSIIAKYKPPTQEEYRFLSPGKHLCAIFHAEGNIELVRELCKRKVIAYSYEFLKTQLGDYPLAFAGAEISGKLAVLNGAYFLQKSNHGMGILLANIVGAQKPKVVVIGYGNAGGAAIRMAISLGVLSRKNPWSRPREVKSHLTILSCISSIKSVGNPCRYISVVLID